MFQFTWRENPAISTCRLCTGQENIAELLNEILQPRLGYSPFDNDKANKHGDWNVPKYPIFSGVNAVQLDSQLAFGDGWGTVMMINRYNSQRFLSNKRHSLKMIQCQTRHSWTFLIKASSTTCFWRQSIRDSSAASQIRLTALQVVKVYYVQLAFLLQGPVMSEQ